MAHSTLVSLSPLPQQPLIPPGLTFRYGVVGAGKTAALLALHSELVAAGLRVTLTKPRVDTRHGELIASRNGQSAHPSILIAPHAPPWILVAAMRGADVVLIDEVQFLTHPQIGGLRTLATETPVICYGLRTDFRGFAFKGSRRLFELADRVEAIPAVCQCGQPAAFNAHTAGLNAPGAQVQIGGDELFRAACYSCWAPAPPAEPVEP